MILRLLTIFIFSVFLSFSKGGKKKDSKKNANSNKGQIVNKDIKLKQCCNGCKCSGTVRQYQEKKFVFRDKIIQRYNNISIMFGTDKKGSRIIKGIGIKGPDGKTMYVRLTRNDKQILNKLVVLKSYSVKNTSNNISKLVNKIFNNKTYNYKKEEYKPVILDQKQTGEKHNDNTPEQKENIEKKPIEKEKVPNNKNSYKVENKQLKNSEGYEEESKKESNNPPGERAKGKYETEFEAAMAKKQYFKLDNFNSKYITYCGRDQIRRGNIKLLLAKYEFENPSYDYITKFLKSEVYLRTIKLLLEEIKTKLGKGVTDLINEFKNNKPKIADIKIKVAESKKDTKHPLSVLKKFVKDMSDFVKNTYYNIEKIDFITFKSLFGRDADENDPILLALQNKQIIESGNKTGKINPRDLLSAQIKQRFANLRMHAKENESDDESDDEPDDSDSYPFYDPKEHEKHIFEKTPDDLRREREEEEKLRKQEEEEERKAKQQELNDFNDAVKALGATREVTKLDNLKDKDGKFDDYKFCNVVFNMIIKDKNEKNFIMDLVKKREGINKDNNIIKNIIAYYKMFSEKFPGNCYKTDFKKRLNDRITAGLSAVSDQDKTNLSNVIDVILGEKKEENKEENKEEDKKEIECSICGFKPKDYRFLLLHMKAVHKDDSESDSD